MKRITIGVLALAGCADFVEQAGERHERHVAGALSDHAKRIQILESNDAGQPTEVLGIVDVHEKVGSQEEALAELREHADELGADAVLGVEFHHGEAGPAPTHLSGIAVRYRDLLHGRSYQVIRELEATAPMGHEEEADAELSRQAREVHADLILNVQFHHGEGEAPVRVTGKAIRFTQ
jgi:uncharacterized protein YbjQ (UPF0145 family)